MSSSAARGGGGVGVATVIGFGSNAPPDAVLDLLATSVRRGLISSIVSRNSSGLELALLKAPYRTFLVENCVKTGGDRAQAELTLYRLPGSTSDYLLYGADEANMVRSAALQAATDGGGAVVAVWDPSTGSFVGGLEAETAKDSILKSLDVDSSGGGGSDGVETRRRLASAALSSLSALDRHAAEQLDPTSGRRDTVVVVGSGGREHALAVSLARSPLVGSVVCCPGNGGTASERGGKIVNAPPGYGQDNASVVKLTREIGADMVVVGPEAPLVDGLVDELAVECPDVRVFGPTKAAAELEASKAFTKDFLQEHGIPTATYKTFTDADEAISYVQNELSESDRVVVKASGLAAGKGVLLPTTKAETLDAVRQIMSDKSFGDAGDTCVIESFLVGPEASCLAFCDGKTARLMPPAQDHKRALDGDLGLNTGGMGAYCPAPCVTPRMQEEIEGMCIKTVEKMAERGTPYVGVLYAGMMLTPDGPSVLEFNCRFGDPETQVLLPLIETDLYEIMCACCDGTLDSVDLRFRQKETAATVVCAAKGYPESYPKGMAILGLEKVAGMTSAKVYHAGTKLDAGGTARCSGGRVIAVTGIGPSLADALRVAYRGVAKIDFLADGGGGESLMHHRTDIARRSLRRKLRIGVLGSTRGTALVPVIEACASGTLHAEIAAVVSNRSKAPILDKGRAMGGEVVCESVSAKGLSREDFDAECTSILVGAGVEFVILVGYMRILSKPFTDFWAGRCINVHPSLLPKHAGGMDLAVHQAVIDAGESESGCTIHQVTEEVDGGPIVVQKVVQVDKEDTAEMLKAKVQSLEGVAFIEAIERHTGVGRVSYADAGVDIDAGNELVERIKPACKRTLRPGCDAELGGFGGLFDLSAAGYDSADTILIGATDGVGTKLRIAHEVKKHDTVGIDLVAMCVNDLIVTGGEPLFFLDYYATGSLEVEEAAAVVRGIAEGCVQAGCGLIGGETAEMPSMYDPGTYDLAGFSVGAVKKVNILPNGVGVGDVLLGLPSSGIHSNGFSLVRKLLEKESLRYDSPCPWDKLCKSIGESLLSPTKIYVKCCLPLLKGKVLNGLAHITGGGLLENLPRSLPKGIVAEITGHPALPGVFSWIKQASGLDDNEMLRTFNCGVGMVLIVKSDKVEEAKGILKAEGETAVYDLGTLVQGNGPPVVIKYPLS